MDLFDIYYDTVVGIQVLESKELLTDKMRHKVQTKVENEFYDLDSVNKDTVREGYIGIVSVSNNDKIVTSFKDDIL